jgi:hypothetical protein
VQISFHVRPRSRLVSRQGEPFDQLIDEVRPEVGTFESPAVECARISV